MRLPAYPHVLAAQLRASGQVIGMLTCFARPKVELTINSISLASAFGEQLGVIISNYRLQQQAKKLAVLDERQRLAAGASRCSYPVPLQPDALHTLGDRRA